MEPAREQMGLLEGELVLEFGFTREAMASLRREHFEEGVDWTLISKKVWLEPAGVEKLRARLGCPVLRRKKTGMARLLAQKRSPIR